MDPPWEDQTSQCFLDGWLCTYRWDPPGVSRADCSCIFRPTQWRTWEGEKIWQTAAPILFIATSDVFQLAGLMAMHRAVVPRQRDKLPFGDCISLSSLTAISGTSLFWAQFHDTGVVQAPNHQLNGWVMDWSGWDIPSGNRKSVKFTQTIWTLPLRCALCFCFPSCHMMTTWFCHPSEVLHKHSIFYLH